MKSYSSVNKNTYDIIAQNYRNEHTEMIEWEKELKQFVSYIKNEEARIVDLGCGPGTESIWLAQHYSKGHVYAVDISQEMIKLARTDQKNATFIAKNMIHYMPPVKIDGVWARASFHHLTKKELLIQFKAISTYLKQNGVIGMINKYGSNKEIEEKYKYGKVIKRYFQYFDEKLVTLLADRYHLDILKQYIVENDHKWLISYLINK